MMTPKAERAETTRQADLLERAGRYLAGGGLGLFVLPPEVNLVIAEGRGSHVTTVDGRDFIDYHLGSGPALLGHGHPEIVAAVQRQVPKGSTYYFLNEPVIRLAERMVEAIPCADQVHFTGSGTEATFFAMRLARGATGRSKILKFEGGWHGMNDYALWGTVPKRPSPYPNAEPDSIGIPEVLRGQVLVAPFNDAARAVEIIRQNAHELAAVIVEPLQRVLQPVPGFLEAVRATAGLAALDILSRPGAYEHFHKIGGRLRREIEALGARHGFAVQAPGEDAVFGVRFTARKPLRNWEDLLTSDTQLNLRWSTELLTRGILVNPNEKFYLSLAHTDADVDRTLEACDQAFAAIKR